MRGLTGPVFLVSAAVLAFEVLLLRLFAIEQFHHFAYMAIGLALLGFGASGTAIVLAGSRVGRRGRDWLEIAAAGFVLTLLAAVPLAHATRFETSQIVFDPGQWWSLAGVWVALGLPFLTGAGVVVLALVSAGDTVGRVYGANLAGSGAGAGLAIAMLAVAHPARALAMTAVPAALAAAWLLLHRRSAARGAIAAVLVLLAVAASARPPWSLRITPFKGLPQVEAWPGAVRAGERWGPAGWAVAVRAPAFRHAPGLSLGFTGELPAQTALFVDGATAGASMVWRRDAALDFLDWLTAAAPYAAGTPRSVLVLGAGDGLEIANALQHGAQDVTAVELNAPLIALARAVAEAGSSPYDDPAVTVVTGDARTFVASRPGRYDLVVLPVAGAFHATAAGIHGTGENYLDTVDAYEDYIGTLAPGGMLAITRWVRTPPRDNVRAILTAAAALRRRGVEDAGGAFVFLRSWSTATLLVRPSGFSRADIERIRSFADLRFFDLDWPARDGPSPEPFNALERPVFREAAAATAAGAARARAFALAYPFDVRPVPDDRPYAGRFVRLSALPGLLRAPRGNWLPFAEWGHLALLATLVLSAALSAILLLAPIGATAIGTLRARRRSAPAGATRPRNGAARTGLYFGAIGAGYLLIEIAAIQKLTLVLGHPVYAAATTLAAFLAFSGAGSTFSDRLRGTHARTACATIGGIALIVGLLLGATSALLGLPFAARLPITLAILALLAAPMGLAFPLGVRDLAATPVRLAWAWAINGFASVVTASLAVLIAMETGTRMLLVLGAALYFVAAWQAGRAGWGPGVEPAR